MQGHTEKKQQYLLWEKTNIKSNTYEKSHWQSSPAIGSESTPTATEQQLIMLHQNYTDCTIFTRTVHNVCKNSDF